MDFDSAASEVQADALKDILNKSQARTYKARTTMPLHLQKQNAQLMHQVLAKTVADYIVRDFAPKQSSQDAYEVEVVVLTPEHYHTLQEIVLHWQDARGEL